MTVPVDLTGQAGPVAGGGDAGRGRPTARSSSGPPSRYLWYHSYSRPRLAPMSRATVDAASPSTSRFTAASFTSSEKYRYFFVMPVPLYEKLSAFSLSHFWGPLHAWRKSRIPFVKWDIVVAQPARRVRTA